MTVYGVFAHFPFEFTDLIALYENEADAITHVEKASEMEKAIGNYREFYHDALPVQSSFSEANRS